MTPRQYGKHIAVKCENKIQAYLEAHELFMSDAERDKLVSDMMDAMWKSIATCIWDGVEVHIAQNYNNIHKKWMMTNPVAGHLITIHLLTRSAARRLQTYRGHGDYKSMKKNARGNDLHKK